jgi:hypothetical protein
MRLVLHVSAYYVEKRGDSDTKLLATSVFSEVRSYHGSLPSLHLGPRTF